MNKIILSLLLSSYLTTVVNAAIYHIDPGAHDQGNGSASRPFKSWSDLPSMKTGDDVYIRCGTTLT